MLIPECHNSHKHGQSLSRNYILTVSKGTETQQILSHMFVINIKELFASALNGITASVRCVSSMIVVLNAKLTRLIAAHANNTDGEKRRSPTKVPFLLVKTHKRLTSIEVLTLHAKTSLFYTFQRSMRANRNIYLW